MSNSLLFTLVHKVTAKHEFYRCKAGMDESELEVDLTSFDLNKRTACRKSLLIIMAMASINGRILYNDLKMMVAMTYCEVGGIERMERMEFPTIKKKNGIMFTPNNARKRKKNVVLCRVFCLRIESSLSQMIDFCNIFAFRNRII